MRVRLRWYGNIRGSPLQRRGRRVVFEQGKSLTRNLVHLVYCTKNRALGLATEIRPRLFGYQAELFGWQNGYAAFSVSESNREQVSRYIENQEGHHRKMTFQEELRHLSQRHGVEYDERYVWD